MRDGLGQDDPEKGMPAGMPQRTGGLVLPAVNGADAHPDQPVYRGAEGERESEHGHGDAADGHGAENDIVQDHQQHDRGRALNEPGACARGRVGKPVPVPADHEHRKAQRGAQENGQQGDQHRGADALEEKLPAVLPDEGFLKALADACPEARAFGGPLDRGHRGSAVVGRAAEQHALGPLRGHGDPAGGEIALAALHGGDHSVKVHGDDFQRIPVRLTEPGGNIHVVPDLVPVQHEGEGREGRIQRHAQRAVHRGQRFVNRQGIPAFIAGKPFLPDLLHRAVRPQLLHKGAVLIPQGLAPVRPGEERRQVGMVEHRFNLQIAVGSGDKLKRRQFAGPCVDLPGAEGGEHIRLVVEIAQLDIRNMRLRHFSADRSGLHADAQPAESGKVRRARLRAAVRRRLRPGAGAKQQDGDKDCCPNSSDHLMTPRK